VLTPAREPVTLPAHQQAVAERARLLAAHAGLAAELAGALHAAGAHHDDGKADPRFQQVRLGLPPGTEVLAKSLPGSTVRQILAAEGQALEIARSTAAQIVKFDAFTRAAAKKFIKPIPADELRREIDLFCELFLRPAVMAALQKFVESTDAMPYLP